jgi:cytochrome P450
MCICLAAVLKHPAWLAELRAELDGWDGKDVMALSRLPKLKATIMEAQRYYPLVFFNFRQAARNFEYKGFQFETGQFITHAQSTCHFLEEMYVDPLEFKPQRFVEDGRFIAKTNGFFGGGTHICLGRNYTMLQTPIALAQMIKYYDIEFAGDPAGPAMPAGSALKELAVKVSPRRS